MPRGDPGPIPQSSRPGLCVDFLQGATQAVLDKIDPSRLELCTETLADPTQFVA